MERLTRYDVAEYKGVAMVVIESDLLPLDGAQRAAEGILALACAVGVQR